MEHIKDILAKGVKRQPMKKDSLGSNQDTDKPIPECSLCGDEEWVHINYNTVVPCSCRVGKIKKRLTENLIRYCHLPERTENKTFETFEDRDKKCAEAKAAAYRIACGDDNLIFLTLLSTTGRGKSHLAIAICRERLKRGEPAKYAFVPELLQEIRDSYHRDEITGQSYSQLLDQLGAVPLLVLDDLGTEKKSEWACEQLQTIIDHRSRSALPLVVTTNKSLDELPNDDEGRISSRLQRESWCKVVVF